MKTIAVLHQIISWLKTTELFLNPVKLLPGKWYLFEYYIDSVDELVHVQEKQLAAEKFSWYIEFSPDNLFISNTNLSIPIISENLAGTWKKSGNFLLLYNAEKPSDLIKFQFAVEKESLKLLKKDSKGKIEIFGFFRKAE